MEDSKFYDNWDLGSQIIISVSLRTFTYEAERTLDPPKPRSRQHYGATRTQAPGCQRSSCRSVRRGRGGDRYSQRRSKVQGEDLDTYPRPPRGDRVRRDVRDLGSWVPPPWLARDKPPGLYRFPNIASTKQINTHKSLPLTYHGQVQQAQEYAMIPFIFARDFFLTNITSSVARTQVLPVLKLT